MASSFIFVVDKRGPQAAIDLAKAAISPTSLAQFLTIDAHEVIEDRLDKRFKNEGDDATGPWAPLAYPTQQIRRSLGLGDMHPINIRTGELLKWLQDDRPAIVLGGTGAGYSFPGSAPSDQQTSEKFTTAQKGGPKKSTPARPVVAANETDLALITARLEEFIRAHMGGYFA